MADHINEIARDHAAVAAANYDDQAEDEAVEALTVEVRRYVEDQGWDPADFQVDLENIARDELRRHRGAQ